MFPKTLLIAKRLSRRMLRFHQTMMWKRFGRKRERQIDNLLSSVPALADELVILRQRIDEIEFRQALSSHQEREETSGPVNSPSSSF